MYYGCLKGSSSKWLDLAALSARLLPRDRIIRIRYFTARVSGRPPDHSQPARQQVYLRALATIRNLSVHYGHFLTNTCRMALAHPAPSGPTTVEVIKTEEKGSDVNMATYLLVDAFKQGLRGRSSHLERFRPERADRHAQSTFSLTVGVVNPHPPNRRSRALRPTFFKQIRHTALASSQFSGTLQDARGVITKPTTW